MWKFESPNLYLPITIHWLLEFRKAFVSANVWERRKRGKDDGTNQHWSQASNQSHKPRTSVNSLRFLVFHLRKIHIWKPGYMHSIGRIRTCCACTYRKEHWWNTDQQKEWSITIDFDAHLSLYVHQDWLRSSYSGEIHFFNDKIRLLHTSQIGETR